MDDLERTVRKLAAAEDIKKLKAYYAHLCDIGYPPDRIADLFVEDGIWDGGEMFGVQRGKQAIHDFFDNVRGSISWALHYMIAPSIEVADDLQSATGSWYLWQPCTVDGNPIWLCGLYNDVYVNVDGAWKYKELHLDLQAATPFDKGWVEQRFIAT